MGADQCITHALTAYAEPHSRDIPDPDRAVRFLTDKGTQVEGESSPWLWGCSNCLHVIYTLSWLWGCSRGRATLGRGGGFTGAWMLSAVAAGA